METAFTDIPQTKRIVITHINRITAQCFFVVFYGIVCGVSILFQMQAGQIKLFSSLYFFREQGCFSSVGNRFHFFRFRMPIKQFPSVCRDFKNQFIKFLTIHIYHFIQQFFRGDSHFLAIIYFPVFTFQDDVYRLARSSKYLEANAVLPFRFNIHQQIPAGILHHSQFPVRQEILNETLFFIRLQPSKVRLIFSIYTCH